ncbi:MAG: hypothetical protein MJZ75_02990 [Paludibacteraceae bacterium]|nr:hypothetical protein [Paludibacteraceae bacterium]
MIDVKIKDHVLSRGKKHAKVQQKFDMTKYFVKKMRFFCRNMANRKVFCGFFFQSQAHNFKITMSCRVVFTAKRDPSRGGKTTPNKTTQKDKGDKGRWGGDK